MTSHGGAPAEVPRSLLRRRWLHAAALGAIGLAILAGLLARFSWNSVAVATASVPFAFLGAAFASEAGTIFLKTLRWVLLLGRAPGAARAYLIGQAMNQVAPAGTGEAARLYVGKVRSGIPVKSALTAIVAERVADTAFLVAVTPLAFPHLFPPRSGGGAPRTVFPEGYLPVTVGGALAILAVGILFLVRPSLLGALGRLAAKLRWPERPFREIQEAVEALRTRRIALGSVLLLTPLAWILEAGALAVLLAGTGAPIPFATAFIFTCVAELVGALSFLPGGIGARELVIAVLISTVGGSGAQAVAASLLFRLIAASSLAAGALGGLATYPRARAAGP